jgi:type I restriction enzyme R subunit
MYLAGYTAGQANEQYPAPAVIGPIGPISPIDPIPSQRRKYYFDGGQVEIAAELLHKLDADGKQPRVVKLTDYTAEKVRTLCTGLEDLRTRWADATERAAIIEQLAERGIDFHTVAAQAGKSDADPFDLLCHLAFSHLSPPKNPERVTHTSPGRSEERAPPWVTPPQ